MTVTVMGSTSVVIVWVLPYGGFSEIHDWFVLMPYELCVVLDFCRLKMPVAFVPFGADKDRADGKAWIRGVNEPLGGGGGGVAGGGDVVEGGGGGGVVEGGGGVAEGGGGGGGVVPEAVTVREMGMRKV